MRGNLQHGIHLSYIACATSTPRSYPSLLGIKVVNLVTNQCVRVLGEWTCNSCRTRCCVPALVVFCLHLFAGAQGLRFVGVHPVTA